MSRTQRRFSVIDFGPPGGGISATRTSNDDVDAPSSVFVRDVSAAVSAAPSGVSSAPTLMDHVDQVGAPVASTSGTLLSSAQEDVPADRDSVATVERYGELRGWHTLGSAEQDNFARDLENFGAEEHDLENGRRRSQQMHQEDHMPTWVDGPIHYPYGHQTAADGSLVGWDGAPSSQHFAGPLPPAPAPPLPPPMPPMLVRQGAAQGMPAGGADEEMAGSWEGGGGDEQPWWSNVRPHWPQQAGDGQYGTPLYIDVPGTAGGPSAPQWAPPGGVARSALATGALARRGPQLVQPDDRWPGAVHGGPQPGDIENAYDPNSVSPTGGWQHLHPQYHDAFAGAQQAIGVNGTYGAGEDVHYTLDGIPYSQQYPQEYNQYPQSQYPQASVQEQSTAATPTVRPQLWTLGEDHDHQPMDDGDGEYDYETWFSALNPGQIDELISDGQDELVMALARRDPSLGGYLTPPETPSGNWDAGSGRNGKKR